MNIKVSKTSKPGVKAKDKRGNCIICNKAITNENYNSSIGSKYCSWRCYEYSKKQSKEPNCKCSICGKGMYLKPSRLKRVKHGVVCSDKCKSEQKSIIMSGKGNHQYGLKGDKNSSFKGDVIINQYGYKMKYLPTHPLSDENGRYREHRYIIEQSNKYDSSYFKYINGIKVLKSEFEVHHINENKLDNNINNLQVLTKSEHRTYHNKEKTIIRNKSNGQIIGVFKSGELLENLEEDNQQPS